MLLQWNRLQESQCMISQWNFLIQALLLLSIFLYKSGIWSNLSIIKNRLQLYPTMTDLTFYNYACVGQPFTIVPPAWGLAGSRWSRWHLVTFSLLVLMCGTAKQGNRYVPRVSVCIEYVYYVFYHYSKVWREFENLCYKLLEQTFVGGHFSIYCLLHRYQPSSKWLSQESCEWVVSTLLKSQGWISLDQKKN